MGQNSNTNYITHIHKIGMELFGKEILVSIHLGSRPRPEVKYTGQFIEYDSFKSLGFFKIGKSISARKLLLNEISTLKKLRDKKFSSAQIPKVLFQRMIDNSLIFVINPIKENYRYFSKKFTELHALFIIELFSVNNCNVFWENSLSRKKIVENNEFLNNIISLQANCNFEMILMQLDNKLNNIIIPHGLAHRDFVPWNTKYLKKRIFVFDWEYSDEKSVILWDAFNFIIHCLSKRKIKKGHLYEIIKHEIIRQPILLSFYKSKMNDFNLKYLKDIFILYCLDFCVLYLQNNCNDVINISPWLDEIKNYSIFYGKNKK